MRTRFPRQVLEDRILKTLLYSDMFDYPLTQDEIHEQLITPIAEPLLNLIYALDCSSVLKTYLDCRDGFYFFRGRSEIVDLRIKREAVFRRHKAEALKAAKCLSAIPFVRMVGLSGSFPMANTDEQDDIDFFIVTESNRLWIARTMCIILCRMCCRGLRLNPNIFVSNKNLDFGKGKSLLLAHDLSFMAPIFGKEVYKKICLKNKWVEQFLANIAFGKKENEYWYLDSNPRHRLEKTLTFLFSDRFLSWLNQALFALHKRWFTLIRGYRSIDVDEACSLNRQKSILRGHYPKLERLFGEKLIQFNLQHRSTEEKDQLLKKLG